MGIKYHTMRCCYFTNNIIARNVDAVKQGGCTINKINMNINFVIQNIDFINFSCYIS